MQIRQLEALQAMARSSSSKVVFVPMNLSGMGAAGMDHVAQQMAASGHEGDYNAQAGPGPASNAGLISAMASV